MSKYKRLGSNTLLVFIGNTGSKLIGLLMLPFYTKWLSVADYGTFNLITIYVSFLLGLVTFSIAESIFIFPKDQLQNKQKEYFSSGLFIVTVSFIVTGFVFYILKFSLLSFEVKNTFTQYVWVVYWMIAASFLQAYVQQFARSIDKIKVYAITGIVLTASLAALSVFLIPKYGLKGYIIGQILASFIATIYSFIFSRAYLYLSIFAIKKERFKEMLKYSIPLIPNGIMWWFVSALNRPMLEKYHGIDSVGIIAVANRFPALIAMLFSIFAVSWQISVLEEFNKEGYKLFYNKILRVILVVLTFASCALAVSSKFIISIMADASYFEAWKFVPILSIAVLFSSLSSYVGMNFSAVRESKYYFYSSVWGAITSIVFNFLLIPSFGLWGAAISVVLAHLSMAISRTIYSWQYVQISSIKSYLGMLLINIAVILSIFFIESFSMKFFIIILLLLLFLYINKSLTTEVKLLFSLIKSKLDCR